MNTEQNIRGDLFSLKPLEYFNPITNEWLIEQFKPIKGYEGLYEVSNCGRVKSLAKEWVGGTGGIRRKPETISNPGIDNHGYCYVSLCKNGKKKIIRIHLLVWDAFGDRPRNGHKLQVDHKDENKLNYQFDNLQLLTNRENISKYHLLQKLKKITLGSQP